MDDELAALAEAHGVATYYEDAGQRRADVDPDVVVAVLAQLDVDASTPEAVRRALAAPRPEPKTLVLREGEVLEGTGTVVLEDGGEVTLPAELPLGYHRLGDRTVVVAPRGLRPVPKTWGWMLQLYAMRSAESWGMGDFADLATIARRSAEELDAGVLLVNPVQAISPTAPVERSPYSPSSRRFANPLYLRITDLPAYRDADAATRAAVDALRSDNDTELIDYDAVWTAKKAALELLWADVDHVAPEGDLKDFARFCALAETHGPDWRSWPEPQRDPATATADPDRVAFHAWLQDLCEQQLADARRAAGAMPVGIVHDLPVGVHPGGADTWAVRDAFAPDVRVGAPPDAFSQLGQDWNLPPWRPDKLAEQGYEPFRAVIRNVLKHADGIRIDHVAGLWRLWWIPPGEPPKRGTYVHYDDNAMLAVLTLEAHRADAVVVGEDLGTVEPKVTEALHAHGMLSSAVLWFQRDYDQPGHPLVPPEKWTTSAMASISTHDLPTVAGFLSAEHVRVRADLGQFEGAPDGEYRSAARERAELVELLEQEGVAADDLITAFHALLARAPSLLLLTSPQDALGETRQPNLPGTVDQYPNWRIPLPVGLAELFADARVRRVAAALASGRGR
ncbi:4-alpha-glucanotransferase [Saccharothrix tamanrassetensis]|uniref:4-alpha-glucanotransferase n=1 Tax=Saccharothrix tamanrassetensis TaxID=1051531 RepID=A0A841CLA1_9PSEU|nr:4-alpha-glucanotransferase [Saccharothrix tamanrassetensis]MBB5956775.1 4-alpha-glucanotransferase [Saccharothrix tamanrassetensis]